MRAGWQVLFLPALIVEGLIAKSAPLMTIPY